MPGDTFCQGHLWYFNPRRGVLSSEPCRLRWPSHGSALLGAGVAPQAWVHHGWFGAFFFSPPCLACEKDLFYI